MKKFSIASVSTAVSLATIVMTLSVGTIVSPEQAQAAGSAPCSLETTHPYDSQKIMKCPMSVIREDALLAKECGRIFQGGAYTAAVKTAMVRGIFAAQVRCVGSATSGNSGTASATAAQDASKVSTIKQHLADKKFSDAKSVARKIADQRLMQTQLATIQAAESAEQTRTANAATEQKAVATRAKIDALRKSGKFEEANQLAYALPASEIASSQRLTATARQQAASSGSRGTEGSTAKTGTAGGKTATADKLAGTSQGAGSLPPDDSSNKVSAAEKAKWDSAPSEFTDARGRCRTVGGQTFCVKPEDDIKNAKNEDEVQEKLGKVKSDLDSIKIPDVGSTASNKEGAQPSPSAANEAKSEGLLGTIGDSFNSSIDWAKGWGNSFNKKPAGSESPSTNTPTELDATGHPIDYDFGANPAKANIEINPPKGPLGGQGTAPASGTTTAQKTQPSRPALGGDFSPQIGEGAGLGSDERNAAFETKNSGNKSATSDGEVNQAAVDQYGARVQNNLKKGKDYEISKDCGTSAKIGVGGCGTTRFVVENGDKAIGGAQVAGGMAMQVSGNRNTAAALQSGTASGAYDATAASYRDAAKMQTVTAAIAGSVGLIQGYQALKHSNNIKKIEANVNAKHVGISGDGSQVVYDTNSTGVDGKIRSLVAGQQDVQQSTNQVTAANGYNQATVDAANRAAAKAAKENSQQIVGRIQNAAVEEQKAVRGVAGMAMVQSIAVMGQQLMFAAASKLAAKDAQKSSEALKQPETKTPGFDPFQEDPNANNGGGTPLPILGNGENNQSASSGDNSSNGGDETSGMPTLPTPMGVPGNSGGVSGPGVASNGGGGGGAAPAGGAGSGAGPIGMAGSTQPADMGHEDNNPTASTATSPALQSGAGASSYGQGGGKGGNGSGDTAGIDLKSLLAQFLPGEGKEDPTAQDLNFAGADRAPASVSDNAGLLDSSVNIFQRVHDAYQVAVRAQRVK